MACPEVYGDHLNQATQAREPVASPLDSIVIQDHVLLQGPQFRSGAYSHLVVLG